MANANVQNNFSLQEIVKKEYVENDTTLCFDNIPIYKVIILTIVTGGFYEFILFYSWWKKLKIDFGYNVSPFWRSVFSALTAFWLFSIFEKYFKCFNIRNFKAGIFATLFFFSCFISNRIALYNDTNIHLQILDWILTLVITAICCLLQNHINTINQRNYPQAKNNGWKISNTVWVVICLVLLIFSIVSD